MIAAPTRPVLRYHGGKWVLAPWIIEHFPPHRVYVEPFGADRFTACCSNAVRWLSKLADDMDVVAQGGRLGRGGK